MAANEYVQAAAAQLQNGANAIKKEMDQLRADFMTYERQAKSEIDSKESEIHALNARLAAGQPDASAVAMQLRIQHLQGDINDKKREIVDCKSQMNNAISAKEGSINDLMSQSRGLQNKAASLR